MSGPPVMWFEWSGEAMVPLRPKLADQHFTVHERYPLEVREQRSSASHAHYFASIMNAWANLPEAMAERWPSTEHLRKWALIQAGFRDERSIVCASKAEAQRVAAFIKPMDDYAVVLAKDAIVLVYTAKSQSMRAMGKKEFYESKEKVLDVLAGLLGTNAAELKRAEAA